MASMRDIKRRKGSIQSTQQITKAMKLVSTVKLQRARQNAERTESYFSCMYDTVTSILAMTTGMKHPYLDGGASGKTAVIVMTSNRGLAGGYNSNIAKLVAANFDRKDTVIYAVGKKGRDALSRQGYTVVVDASEMAEEPVYADAMQLSARLLKDFEKGEISSIYLAYTRFKNTVSHIPTLLQLLPVQTENTGAETAVQEAKDAERKDVEAKIPMNFEMEEEEALNMLIPKYVTSLIYGGLVEAAASENGARMQAMDSATSNAEEMIEDLALMYNRARQGSITQELTEIIAGAGAIS